ncbi:DUF2157 domain-containing protein [Oscillatoria sp. CS-180]|uniref:DUF2157 domain-containing protein n=1 Tax=Oscillatoria sp. CS-180 TaxID=3021720 RepID=UPI0023306811|nr:DUF2157 domain-containing protein [Oscillatoria sp. CS-180]MDB9528177.1 DUF2157 domain-containing protein [Oscillatoria sp. CS-180]
MASDAFRRELQQEAQRWRSEGLITDKQFQQLAEDYDFADIETAARDRFIMILLGLGSILVGIGAITFVAANWQALSQTAKAGMMFFAMVICNLSGFILTNRISPSDRWRRLGQALLLLGAILLGANLALMGQIVHTSDTRYELCAAWAMGVLVMAYGVRLPFLGMFALLILGIGYWSALWDMLWLQDSLFGVWTLQTMPLLLTALFLPLAYRCQSPLLFALSAIAITSSLSVLILDIGRSLPALFEAILMVLPFALLWAYDDSLWLFLKNVLQRQGDPQPVMADDEMTQPFQPIARGLMLFSLSLLYWLLSFLDMWSAPASRGLLNTQLLWRSSALVVLTLVVFTIWTVGSWLYLGWRQEPKPWRLDSLSGTMLLFLSITAALLFWTFVAGPIATLATTVINILLALLSLGMMREGLGSGARTPFWWGLVLLTVQILSRVLEYEQDLLIKSVVFVVCGIGVIFVGLWFERYVRTLRTDSA